MRRVAITGISGSGKTTTARRLAERLGVAFVEVDALHHGPGWAEATADELRGNRETVRNAFPTRDSLFGGAIRSHRRNPREIPARATRNPQVELVRLRSAAEVERWLASAALDSPTWPPS